MIWVGDCTTLDNWEVYKPSLYASKIAVTASDIGINVDAYPNMNVGVSYGAAVSQPNFKLYGDFEIIAHLSIPEFIPNDYSLIGIGISLTEYLKNGGYRTGTYEVSVYIRPSNITINNGYKTSSPNIVLPWEGELRLVRSDNNIEFWANNIKVRSFTIEPDRLIEMDCLGGPMFNWTVVQGSGNSFTQPLGYLHGYKIIGDIKGAQWPLQTGKDYVLVTPFPGGTMKFGGKEYKFIKYLERFDKEQHQVAGVSRAYEYGGPLVKYGEQTYGFLASGITDPAAEGGFGTYLPDTKRTVLSLADRENFVNFYYIYPALPQVEKPVWVKKVITWKDVPGATAYEVKLFLDTEEQCIDTQLVGPGVQRFDFTYFIDLFMPAGSYHCTVQALAAEVTHKAIVWVDTPGATSYTVNLYNSDGEIVYTDSVAPGVQTYDFTAIIPTLPTGTNYYGVAIPVIPA